MDFKGILDGGAKVLREAVGLPVPVAGRGRVGSEYMKGGRSPFFWNWNPALRDTRDDIRQSYLQAAARAIDSIHNSGWLSGGVNQSIAATMGTSLRLASQPDADALGWKKEAADEWARSTERRWEAWAKNPMECDAGGRFTMGQQARAVTACHFSHGEGLALLPMISRPGSQTRTKVKLLLPHKLVQDSNGFNMQQGVIMDAWGLPVAYRIRMRPQSAEGWEDVYTVPARDGVGRPQVLHIFDGGPDQVRGLTPLAPVLRVLRQYDQLSDGTLTSTLLKTIFAATIESEAPTADILQALQDDDEQGVGGGNLEGLLTAKGDWYENTKIDLGRFGKVAHLFPGEKLNFQNNQSPDATYEAFAKFLLREIARCLGLTFEELTGDYSGATYSSVRMGTSVLWPVTMQRRVTIPGRFYQQVYEAWLEEQIERGFIKFPGGIYAFYLNREAASRADWRGPAKPQADDLKTQKAHEGYKRMGVMSDEQICADLGFDWEDVYEQRGREKKLREKLDLPDGDTMTEAQDDALVNSLLNEPDKTAA